MMDEDQFIEVFVDTPLSVCEQRDVKGMYAKARRGEIKEFTGISDPYEPPLNPEITLDTGRCTPEENARRIMAELAQRGFVRWDAATDRLSEAAFTSRPHDRLPGAVVPSPIVFVNRRSVAAGSLETDSGDRVDSTASRTASMASCQGIVEVGEADADRVGGQLDRAAESGDEAALEAGGGDRANDDLALALDRSIRCRAPARGCGARSAPAGARPPPGSGRSGRSSSWRMSRRARARPRPRRRGGTSPAAARCRRCSRPG